MTLQLGSKGEAVKQLQYKLKKVLNRNISIDGDFGKITEQAVKDFQRMTNLYVDGVAGVMTQAKLDSIYRMMHEQNSGLLTFGKRRFVVFVDAGHGSIDNSGKYVTPGKRYFHENMTFHERGHFYEGYENRIIAEAFIDACSRIGINCIRTYHPYKDTSLSERTELVRSWLKRGYYGYLHSFHSNAISLENSAEKLRNTRGFIVFNTRGNTLSDIVAQQHFNHVKSEFGNEWIYREDRTDGDSDYEANFQILRETDLLEFDMFGAILDEWGFFTSSIDTEFITRPINRGRRIKCCVQTAIWVKQFMQQRLGLSD